MGSIRQPSASKKTRQFREQVVAPNFQIYLINQIDVVRPDGFEPPTPAFEARYSIQLSYGRLETSILRRSSRVGALFGHSALGVAIAR